MSPAAKVSLLIELLQNGFLCKCSKWTSIEEDDSELRESLVHEPDCEGRLEVMRLLHLKEEL